MLAIMLAAGGSLFGQNHLQYQTLLPAQSCESVDMSPDGSIIYAKANFADYDVGAKAFSATNYAHLSDYHAFGTPWTIRASANGAYLYGSDYYGGNVDKVSVATDTVTTRISVGSWPGGLAFDSNRRFLYVGQNDPGTGVIGSIKRIDTNTDTVVGSRTLNGEPAFCIQVSPDNAYVYAASRGNGGNETLYKILAADMTVAGTFSMAGAGEAGWSLSPDGSKAYIPFTSANRISVVDLATMTLSDQIAISNPGACWLSPDGAHALVTSATTSEVELRWLDLQSNSVLDTLTFGNIGTVYISNTLRVEPYWDWDGPNKTILVPLSASDGGVAVLTPEPATLSLLALGGLAVLRRRRGKVVTKEGHDTGQIVSHES